MDELLLIDNDVTNCYISYRNTTIIIFTPQFFYYLCKDIIYCVQTQTSLYVQILKKSSIDIYLIYILLSLLRETTRLRISYRSSLSGSTNPSKHLPHQYTEFTALISREFGSISISGNPPVHTQTDIIQPHNIY